MPSLNEEMDNGPDANTGRTALVLAGGGVSGAVYEIGALRAIDDLLVNRTVNDFDIYVGTSAGALVGSFLANGMSSIDLMRVVNGTHPVAKFPEPKHLFRFNTREFVRRSFSLPRRVVSTGLEALANRGRISVLDLIFSGLGEALPSGIYDNRSYGEWVADALRITGGTDRFDQLSKELYIIATQLGNGERTVFSRSTPEVNISTAVAASSAVPVMYKPVRIGEAEYIDGGVRGNASLDLAIEHGAKLVVVINSLVPFDSSEWNDKAEHTSGRFISARGLEAVSAQATRVLLHSGLKYQIKQLQRRHPDVDIILIEPSSRDSVMFFANIMRLQDRIAIAEHGFRSVSVDLAGGYEVFRDTLARYGIQISPNMVRKNLEEIARSGHNTAVIQRVLERSSPPQAPNGNSVTTGPLADLEQTLSVLERKLEAYRA